MKKLLSIFISLLLVFTSLTLLTGCGNKEADAIMIKSAPTVKSLYGEKLAIESDGVIYVKYADGERAEVKVTLDMIDQKGFNNKSLEEQTLKIVYGGKSVDYKIKLVRLATKISVKTNPSVLSYTEMPLEIADDGVLSVEYKDGDKADVKLTYDMLDLTNFDIESSQEQSITVNYGGISTTLKLALTVEAFNDEGETKTYRFEAEDGEYGGDGWVGIEDCQGQTRADGSQEVCVKGLHQTEAGGYLLLKINCDRKTHVKMRISISRKGGADPNYDEYTRFTINGQEIATKIVLDNSTENGWWDWVVYEIDVDDLALKHGVNEILLETNSYANKDVVSLSGRNVNWIEIDSTGTLTWATDAE